MNSRVVFFSHFNKNSYNKSFEASKNNNDKFSMLLSQFFAENNIILSKLNNVFINQGPGKFSGIRNSIAVAKALAITNKLNFQREATTFSELYKSTLIKKVTDFCHHQGINSMIEMSTRRI